MTVPYEPLPQPGGWPPATRSEAEAPRLPLEALEQPGLLLPTDHPGGEGYYAFHRLTWLDPHKHWWRPAIVAAVGAFATLVLSLLVGGLAGVGALLSKDPDATFTNLMGIASGKVPASLSLIAFMLASVAIMIPALYLGYLAARQRNLGYLWSVTGRLRWGWLGRCLGFAALIQLAYLVLGLGLDGMLNPAGWNTPDLGPYGPLAVAGVFAILLPLQCTAEELVFRGFVMQAVGTWLRHPAWAIAAQVPLFALGHLYGGWAMVDIVAFAVVAGWVTWRTGGLEAAMAFHIANNAAAFFLSLWVEGTIDSTATGDAWSLVTSLVLDIVYVGIIEVATRRHHPAREVCIGTRDGVSYREVPAWDYRNQPITVRVPAAPTPRVEPNAG